MILEQRSELLHRGNLCVCVNLPVTILKSRAASSPGTVRFEARLRLLGPEQVLARGYSITMHAETAKIIRSSSEVGSQANVSSHSASNPVNSTAPSNRVKKTRPPNSPITIRFPPFYNHPLMCLKKDDTVKQEPDFARQIFPGASKDKRAERR